MLTKSEKVKKNKMINFWNVACIVELFGGIILSHILAIYTNQGGVIFFIGSILTCIISLILLTVTATNSEKIYGEETIKEGIKDYIKENKNIKDFIVDEEQQVVFIENLEGIVEKFSIDYIYEQIKICKDRDNKKQILTYSLNELKELTTISNRSIEDSETFENLRKKIQSKPSKTKSNLLYI